MKLPLSPPVRPAGLSVTTDLRRLAAVVAKLLLKAIMQGETPYQVHTLASGEDVVIEVSDHGACVPEDSAGISMTVSMRPIPRAAGAARV